MKLGAVGALAIGYLLGARAGRDRYEQIRRLASEAAEYLEAYGSDSPLAARIERGGSARNAGAEHQ